MSFIYNNYIILMINKIISLILLIISLPVLIFFMLLIITFDNHYPIFIQERLGKDMKPFNIIKLKTIKNNIETPIGSFLRQYSIDEIPQLINIIKSEMNIIGPRPLLKDEYTNIFLKKNINDRTLILPGITGYHKAFGDSDEPNQRFEMDMFYIKNKNFELDLFIIIKTILNTIKGKKFIRYFNK